MSGTVTISELRSNINIETLGDKNPTEIHGVLSEVCGEFTVERSTISRWASRFPGGCISIDNDSRPGKQRTSEDESSSMLVADAHEENRATC